MMPETRKDAPLPPEPWCAADNYQGYIQIRDADNHYVACVSSHHPQRNALAALIVAAPGTARRNGALESEVARLTAERDATCRARDQAQAEAKQRALEYFAARNATDDCERRCEELADSCRAITPVVKEVSADLTAARRERDALLDLLRATWEVSEFWPYVPAALQARYRKALEKANG